MLSDEYLLRLHKEMFGDVWKWAGKFRERDTNIGVPSHLMRGWNDAIAAVSSEDCLFLNIWTPAITEKARLPVMVFFPGGANQGGSARGDTAIEPLYDGEKLASHGVIVVRLTIESGSSAFWRTLN